jgi:hypothetical protein
MYGSTLNATMNVTPFTYLFSAYNVVVGNVHATCVGYLSVNDDNLPVVTREDVVNPREANRVELVYLNTVIPKHLQMVFLQRTVIGVIAKAVEHGTHLNTLLAFLA